MASSECEQCERSNRIRPASIWYAKSAYGTLPICASHQQHRQRFLVQHQYLASSLQSNHSCPSPSSVIPSPSLHRRSNSFPWPDRDILALISRVLRTSLLLIERQNSVLVRSQINLLRHRNKNVSPRRCIDQIADGKRHVGFEVSGVLREDCVAPCCV